jgi:hypothetical protein
MSIWVRAFCRKSVATATPVAMRDGIAMRWRPMIFLLSPEAEEEPGDVLARLRIEDHSGGEGFRLFHLVYRVGGDRFIRAERWSDEAARQEVEECREDLIDREELEVEAVTALLDDCLEAVGFELKMSDAQGMGMPVAVSAAVWVAEIGDGIVHAEGYGWLLPQGNAAVLMLDD